MPNADTTRLNCVDYAKSFIGQFNYGNQKPQKFEPLKYGFTDCSGFTRFVHLPFGHTLGPMSYNQAEEGTEVASGRTIAQYLAIAHLIKQADVTAFALRSGYGGGSRINHVELNIVKGSTITLGHGSGLGPRIHNATASWLLGDSAFWTVRRFIEDDKETSTETPISFDELEKEIAQMQALFIIFQWKNSICVSSQATNTWAVIPDSKTFQDWSTMKKRNNVTVAEWKNFNNSKSNEVDNPAAFGTKVDWSKF